MNYWLRAHWVMNELIRVPTILTSMLHMRGAHLPNSFLPTSSLSKGFDLGLQEGSRFCKESIEAFKPSKPPVKATTLYHSRTCQPNFSTFPQNCFHSLITYSTDNLEDDNLGKWRSWYPRLRLIPGKYHHQGPNHHSYSSVSSLSPLTLRSSYRRTNLTTRPTW
jgi:hypothetical protein